MSAPYTLIQIKRIQNTSKNFDSDDYVSTVPQYGELVFSHQTNKDELVIGDGIKPIPELPRLNLQKLSSLSKIQSSTTAPSSPSVGDLWVDITNPSAPIIKVYTSNGWKPLVGVWG